MTSVEKVFSTEQSCELFLLRKESLDVQFQNSELKGINLRENDGVGCRVINNNQLGFCTGTEMTSFEKLYAAALESAEFGRTAAFPFAGGTGELEEWSQVDPAIESLDRAAMIDLGQTLSEKLSKEQPNYNSSVSLGKETETIHIASSRGVNKRFTRNGAGLGFALDRTIEGDMIALQDGFSHLPTPEELEAKVAQTYHFLSLCEKVVPLEGGKYPVLFSPTAFTFLLEPLYAGLNARFVFEKTSPLLNRLSEQILSPQLTLLDDPTWRKGANFGHFDDEGVVSRRRTLIDRGILASYLNNLDFAARLGMEPTGNGFRKNFLTNSREIEHGAEILPTNRIIVPGIHPVKDLMNEIKTGVLLIFTADCWLGNLINGDFSGTIDLGFKIIDGQPVGRIKNARFSGSIYQLLGQQLVGISAETDFSYAGYDQFPSILCKDISVS